MPWDIIMGILIKSNKSGMGVAGNPNTPNEPAGFTVVSSQPFDAVPPAYPTLDSYGWAYDRLDNQVTIVSDSTAPRSPSNVARAAFDPAWFTANDPGGGAAPFRLWHWFGGTTTSTLKYQNIYMSVWYKHDTNWSDSGNFATKTGYFQSTNPNTNHWWGFENTDTTLDQLFFVFETQGAAVERTMRSSQTQGPGTSIWQATRGVWNQYEILMYSNTPGVANGILKCWANGTLIINYSDMTWWASGVTAPGWNGQSWEPVYGGGTNLPSYLMYQYCDHWYVSQG